jgi:hypothetical protein
MAVSRGYGHIVFNRLQQRGGAMYQTIIYLVAVVAGVGLVFAPLFYPIIASIGSSSGKRVS